MAAPPAILICYSAGMPRPRASTPASAAPVCTRHAGDQPATDTAAGQSVQAAETVTPTPVARTEGAGGASFGQWIQQSGLPRHEARRLMSLASGRSLTWLIAHADESPDPVHTARFRTLAARRRAGEPLAYLMGEQPFYGRDFRVSPDVLIPRADTETLVEAALERLPASGRPGRQATKPGQPATVPRPSSCPPCRVLDLGTGSGIVAITLALEVPGLEVHAVERSAGALALARENAARHGARVQFHQGSWWQALTVDSGNNTLSDGDGKRQPPGPARFELIVSNPPYIAAADHHLQRGDLRFEPLEALAAGQDGLNDLRLIIAGAPSWLRTGGWLLLEHGYDQGLAVRDLLQAAGFAGIFTRHDLAGQPRVSGGYWR